MSDSPSGGLPVTFGDTDENGRLRTLSWPGAYPLIYYAHGQVYGIERREFLCASCASEYLSGTTSPPDERQESWVGEMWVHIHEEGPPIECGHCQAEIESAYGDPEEEDEGPHNINDELIYLAEQAETIRQSYLEHTTSLKQLLASLSDLEMQMRGLAEWLPESPVEGVQRKWGAFRDEELTLIEFSIGIGIARISDFSSPVPGAPSYASMLTLHREIGQERTERRSGQAP